MKLLKNSELLPKDAKALGRQVKNFDDYNWNQVKYMFMLMACHFKFSQNPELKQELLNTKNKILVEASKTDLVWGVGLAASDPLILDSKNWKGENLLGEVLMDVRNILREEEKRLTTTNNSDSL